MGSVSSDVVSEDVTAAHHNEQRHEELAVQFEEREKGPAGPRRDIVVTGMVFDKGTEVVRIDSLPAETLRHPDTADALGHGRGDTAEAVTLAAIGLTESAAEKEIDAPDDGRDAEDHQKESPVGDGHKNGATEHLSGLNEADKKDVLHSDADILGIAGETTDEAADGVAIEVTHRESEPATEHRGAEVVNDRLPDLEGPLDAQGKGQFGEDRKGHKSRHGPGKLGEVTARDGPVDDRSGRPGEDRQLNRPCAHGDKKTDHFPSIDPGEPEKATDQSKREWCLHRLFFLAALVTDFLEHFAIDNAGHCRGGHCRGGHCRGGAGTGRTRRCASGCVFFGRDFARNGGILRLLVRFHAATSSPLCARMASR